MTQNKNRLIYEKEHGVGYNLFQYFKTNIYVIVIMAFVYGLIFSYSNNKSAVLLTTVAITINTYFLHKYSDYLLGDYNLHKLHHNPRTAHLWWAKIIEFFINSTIYGGAIYLLFFNIFFCIYNVTKF